MFFALSVHIMFFAGGRGEAAATALALEQSGDAFSTALLDTTVETLDRLIGLWIIEWEP